MKIEKTEAKLILDAIRARHRMHFKPDEALELTGEVGSDDVQLRLDMRKRDRSFHLWIETRIDKEENKLDTAVDCYDASLDYLDYTLSEYFRSDRELRFYPDWKMYNYGGLSVWMRGECVNPHLTELADEWLQHDGFKEKGN